MYAFITTFGHAHTSLNQETYYLKCLIGSVVERWSHTVSPRYIGRHYSEGLLYAEGHHVTTSMAVQGNAAANDTQDLQTASLCNNNNN